MDRIRELANKLNYQLQKDGYHLQVTIEKQIMKDDEIDETEIVYDRRLTKLDVDNGLAIKILNKYNFDLEDLLNDMRFSVSVTQFTRVDDDTFMVVTISKIPKDVEYNSCYLNMPVEGNSDNSNTDEATITFHNEIGNSFSVELKADDVEKIEAVTGKLKELLTELGFKVNVKVEA